MRSSVNPFARFLAVLLVATGCGDGGVSPGRPQSRIDILPDSAPTATLHVGDTIRLMARRLDAAGAPLQSDAARFVWSSSDASVAVVNSDGLARIVGTGTAEITARIASAATPGVASITDTARATVTLHGTPLTIEILPESLATTDYLLGDIVRVSAQRVDAAGVPLPDDTVTFVWESSDPTTVGIDDAGLVTFVAVGTSTVRARIADPNDPTEPSTIDTLSATIDVGRMPVVIHPGPVRAGVRMQWSGSPYCVVLADGRLSCRNSAGDWVDRGGDLRFSSISTSNEHSCALATDDRAFCWGGNDNGQLGLGFTRGFIDDGIATELVEVGANHRWLAIDAGGHAQTCGIRTDRAPMCVGHNDMGQVGREPRVASDSVLAGWGSDFHLTTLLTDQFVTCGVEVSGAAYCSGYIGAPASGIPRRVPGPDVFTVIAVGAYHACGLDPAGAAHCWGLNSDGQLGTGDFTHSVEARLVLGGLKFTNIYANWFTTCGVTVGGETWCWGSNDGSLGRPGLSHSKVPIKVGVGLGMRAIEKACGIDALSRFVCWGPAQVGPLGAAARTATAESGATFH